VPVLPMVIIMEIMSHSVLMKQGMQAVSSTFAFLRRRF
jgi:hypothetical protein